MLIVTCKEKGGRERGREREGEGKVHVIILLCTLRL
jgi:hypothetical protein